MLDLVKWYLSGPGIYNWLIVKIDCWCFWDWRVKSSSCFLPHQNIHPCLRAQVTSFTGNPDWKSRLQNNYTWALTFDHRYLCLGLIFLIRQKEAGRYYSPLSLKTPFYQLVRNYSNYRLLISSAKASMALFSFSGVEA